MTPRTPGPALESHYQFMVWLIPALDKFPRSQKFLLGDHMQRTAMEVLDALVAATYSRDRQRHLASANLGLERLRLLSRLSHDLRFFDMRRFEFAVRQLNETGRMVGGWLKADSQAQSTEPRAPNAAITPSSA